jgi:hypothetical protein
VWLLTQSDPDIWQISKVEYENSAWVYELKDPNDSWNKHDSLVGAVDLKKFTGQSRVIGAYPDYA